MKESTSLALTLFFIGVTLDLIKPTEIIVDLVKPKEEEKSCNKVSK